MTKNTITVRERIRHWTTVGLACCLCHATSFTLAQPFGSADNVIDAQAFAVAASAAELADHLETGAVPQDSRSYWACDLPASAELAQLHLRFWRTGEGYSGFHRIHWQAETASSIRISLDDQSFRLTSLVFSDSEGIKTFRGIDANGSTLTCVWSGPPQHQVAQAVLQDPANQLLATQLISADSHAWQCTLQDPDGTTRSRNLRFHRLGIGVSGESDNFAWFVDDRYNVVLSYRDEVAVLHEIRFMSVNSEDDYFEAKQLGSSLHCDRVTVAG